MRIAMAGTLLAAAVITGECPAQPSSWDRLPGAVEASDFQELRSGVKVTWTSYPGAHHYRVFRRLAGTDEWHHRASPGYNGPGPSTLSDTVWVDETAIPGLRYEYMAQAAWQKSLGVNDFAYREMVVTDDGSRHAFRASKADVGAITLYWYAGQAGHHVQLFRRVQGTSEWVHLASPGYRGPRSPDPEAPLTHVDQSVVTGTFYQYRLVCADEVDASNDVFTFTYLLGHLTVRAP